MRGGQVGILHVHSDYSHDGRDSLAELHHFARRRGIGFVALSDHAEDFDRPTFTEYVAECHRLTDEHVRLIPGLEFRFAGYTGLHLLALGLETWISPTTPAEFTTATRKAGVPLTIMAHPVLCAYSCPMDVLDSIDAIEVWNAAYNTRYLPDPRAIRMFQRLRTRRADVIATAGLDQHDASNDREVRVSAASGSDPLALIRAGRFRNIGRTMSFGPEMAWGTLRLMGLTVLRRALDAANRAHDGYALARRS